MPCLDVEQIEIVLGHVDTELVGVSLVTKRLVGMFELALNQRLDGVVDR